MKLRKLFAAASLVAAGSFVFTAAPAVAADDDAPAGKLTFTKDILPILQKNCQDCHRPSGLNMGGMIAPMSFMSYDEVRPWAKSIAKTVADRYMPPWHAAPEQHGIFENERTLTDAQIDKIVKWAESGAPLGNPNDAPTPLQWPQGWAIGEPDLIVSLPEPFEVKDEIDDLNIDLETQITEEQLPEDRYVTAIEFKPGSDVVHHIIAYAIQKDENGETERIMIGGIAPGTEPMRYHEGYGPLLRKGAKFVFQMHYNKPKGPGTARIDRSQVAMTFAPKDAKIKRIHIQPIGDTDRLRVPAGAKDYKITSSKIYEKDILYLGFLPHMHLRGVYSKYVANYPDGTSEVLLETPEWDFNWQTFYKYREPKLIPAGTRVDVTMGYNNSAENPANPDPTIDVVWGEPTYAEMNLGWTWWAYVDDKNEKAVQFLGEGGNDAD